ncbi:MAG: pyrroline-5-carboxylate reductase [Actinomycetota bacterium]
MRVALIGAGRMGAALIKGLINSGYKPDQVGASDANRKRLRELKEEHKIKTFSSNLEAVEEADVIVLAVKPQQIPDVLAEIKESVNPAQTVISIAAGVSISTLEHGLGEGVPVIRVMPNSPALVGAGMAAISPGSRAGERDIKVAREIFSGVGKVVVVEEKFQNLITALSGSGPAYFYLFVEALTEAAEVAGLSLETSLELVTETMLGAARMLIETGQLPSKLIDMVASPGGTTVAALKVFEKSDFKSIVREAVKAALERAKELG